MSTAGKWALRLTLTALAVLLVNDSGRPARPRPPVAKP